MRTLTCHRRPFAPFIVLALAGLLPGRSAARTTNDPTFPPLLSSYLTNVVRLAPEDRSALLAGEPVTAVLDADPSREIALFAAVWIDAEPQAYVKLVRDVENFEKGGAFHVTKRISTPPRPLDFAALHLPDQDVKSLKHCKVGDCEIKLSEEALERIRNSVDWSKPTVKADVEAVFRQIAYEYVKGYVEGGNDRLAVYRDSANPTFVAAEFKSMVERMPELGQHLPELKAYLLEYPKVTLPNGTGFLYWQEVQFGLKPTIRINHVAVDDRPGVTAVAVKLIYASHYFWTALDLRVLIPDRARGRGFWFVNVTRSRSDGLSGFVGKIVRGKAQSEARKGLAAALTATKEKLESAR